MADDIRYLSPVDVNNRNSKNLLLHAYKIKFMINNYKYNFKADYGDPFKNFVKSSLRAGGLYEHLLEEGQKK